MSDFSRTRKTSTRHNSQPRSPKSHDAGLERPDCHVPGAQHLQPHIPPQPAFAERLSELLLQPSPDLPRLSSTDMSTRRTTRGSRAASSTPAPSPAAHIPVTSPRSAARNAARRDLLSLRQGSDDALPAFATMHSNAYGTNTLPPPPRQGPMIANAIEDIIAEQLEPVRAASRANSRVGRAKSPKKSSAEDVRDAQHAVEKSFNQESGIFRDVGIDSSGLSGHEDDLNPIEELDEPASDEAEVDHQFHHMDEIHVAAAKERASEIARARLPIDRVHAARAKHGQSYLNWIDSIKDTVGPFVDGAFKKLGKYLAILLVATVLLWGLSQLVNMPPSFTDLKHTLGNPTEFFQPADVQVINRRLSDLETKVGRLSSRPSDLDPKALKAIQDLLPNFLVAKKDKYGNTIIPDSFWHALQDKIRSDDTLLRDQVESVGKPSSFSSGTSKMSETQAKKLWDKYSRQNEAEIRKLRDADLTRQFPELLKEHRVISKTEVLDIVRQNWEDNQSEIRSQMSDLSTKLHQTTRQINKLQHEFKDESAAIANEVLQKFISSGQIDALASANLKSNVNYGLSRINYFAKGTGATVDKDLTSPAFLFPSHDVSYPEKIKRYLMGNPVPTPNSPYTALIKWEEHGDCWCAPSKGADGFGSSLAVIMSSSIYPDQVVVEHISPSASLEPGAAPREMELLALIPDPELFKAVKKMSDAIFHDHVDDPALPLGYVRIGSWIYDIETQQNIQSFAMGLNMKALGAHTNKVIIRSKTNWGGEAVDYTCLYRVRVHGEVVATPGLY